MDLAAWITAFVEELPGLLTWLTDNVYPTGFLRRVLGLSGETLEDLPRYLLWFIVLYLVCGGITLALHFGLKQKSLNGLGSQAGNILLTILCVFCARVLVFTVEMGTAAVKTVAPLQGDYWRYFSDIWTALYPVIFLAAVLIFTIYMPLYSAVRFLRVYHLRGVPHMIFEMGTGFFLVSVLLLSAARQDRRYCLLLLPAAVMLCLAQTGGYLPDARNTRAAMGADKPSGGAPS